MFEDTIAAISTAPGRAALAVVRVSGSAALEVASAVGLDGLRPRRATQATLRHPESGEVLDRVIATWFAAPASYTGEQVVEISCHGGSLIPRLVLDAALVAGARPAERGEFARRAFLNGKLDLVQVEATLDLVDARSEAQGRAAIFQLEGGLSRRIDAVREKLLTLQAMLGYEIDFPEEDSGPVPAEKIDGLEAGLREELDALLRHAPEGEMLRDGALTVIAGRPNSGKSCLFNALLGIDRALVTELPGTTRDAIEARLSVEGYPFRLVDTAGLREGPEYVEGLGIEVARRYLSEAQLVLYCAEASVPLAAEERRLVERWSAEGRVVLCVRTKGDLLEAGRPEGASPGGGDDRVVSAHRAEGIKELREALLDAVYGGLRASGESPLLTRRRQTRGVRAARHHLREFRAARKARRPAEIAAVHLQDAASALEEVVGIVDHEEVLDAVFGSFCVGK
ncbi:MAG: tRNA uridine-5-carboxymethylaminomethyl(34) synthesis GTPase MnmE [Gemmatimonadota bacterium]